jgi:putative ubiquitin-RnfH superfamily antitoxin RatB of RatAB toxin-antitoxin module
MRITVEVVYGLTLNQHVIRLEVAPGTKVSDVITDSGILQLCPELATDTLRVGIWGRAVDPGTLVRHLDRIEIYRPLSADPKLVRRNRARGRPGQQRVPRR